ncbi:MAG: hypothetical protein JO325_03220 [Solirubrobacterales bacterium]|nr:hypothetical protein [Solirubrobacterales bacterium]
MTVWPLSMETGSAAPAAGSLLRVAEQAPATVESALMQLVRSSDEISHDRGYCFGGGTGAGSCLPRVAGEGVDGTRRGRIIGTLEVRRLTGGFPATPLGVNVSEMSQR